MSRSKKVVALLAVLATLVLVFSFAGCAPKTEPAAPEVQATEAPAAEAPAVEEPVAEAPTTFTTEAGTVYNIVPKDQIVIGFNQGSSTVDFLRMVGENIEAVCEREGIKFISTESNFDVEQILPNVDNLLNQGANIIIDFNVNAEVGGQMVDYCAEKGVPVIGVDVVYPGPSGEVSWFFGANNQMAGEVCGEGLAKAATERWGGEVDNLVLFFNSENGDLVRLRLSGMIDGMTKAGINVTEDKITWIEMGGGGSDTTVAANEKFTDWLAAHPDAKHICVGTVNTETGQGVFSATITSGRQDDVMLATNNNGNQTLSAWESADAKVWLGGSAYLPGQYGEYIVPLAISILAGENPAKVTTMSHVFLTIADIDAVKAEMGIK